MVDQPSKIPAIIPARGGSVRVPQKNIKILSGKPLIYYTIDFCTKSGLFSGVYVSTEEAKIAEISKGYGAIVLDRPAHLAQNNSTDHGFLEHFFGLYPVEEVALMRPTSPFRNEAFVKNGIEKYFEMKEKITGFRSVQESDINPYKVFKIGSDGLCETFFEDFNGTKDFSNFPKQMFPISYVGNGHLDIVKRSMVNLGGVFGDKIYGYVGDSMIDIDTKSDFAYAEWMLDRMGQKD